MEERKLRINIPEGYEIDKEKSTFEEIVFKKVNPLSDLPKTWKEYCEMIRGNTLYYTNCDNRLALSGGAGAHNGFTTKKRAEQFIALGKLLQLRDYWVKGYDGFRYALFGTKIGISIFESSGFSSYSLTFPTKEMAKEFKICFSDLIKKAYPLV